MLERTETAKLPSLAKYIRLWVSGQTIGESQVWRVQFLRKPANYVNCGNAVYFYLIKVYIIRRRACGCGAPFFANRCLLEIFLFAKRLFGLHNNFPKPLEKFFKIFSKST